MHTYIHTYIPATGRAERRRKICGCGIKSADHYFGQRTESAEVWWAHHRFDSMSGKKQQSLVEIEEDDATYSQITYSQTTCPTYIHAYIHAYIHTTQLVHTQLAHTYSSTHNLLHTNPSPSLFSFLLSPFHLYLSFAACWKKLTCGVIRSFNLCKAVGSRGTVPVPRMFSAAQSHAPVRENGGFTKRNKKERVMWPERATGAEEEAVRAKEWYLHSWLKAEVTFWLTAAMHGKLSCCVPPKASGKRTHRGVVADHIGFEVVCVVWGHRRWIQGLRPPYGGFSHGAIPK